MIYEYKRDKPAWQRLLGFVMELSLAFCILGAVSWSALQIDALIARFVHSEATLIRNEVGDVGCVRLHSSVSCFPMQADEPMPEPEAEMSFDDAKKLMEKILVKPKVVS